MFNIALCDDNNPFLDYETKLVKEFFDSRESEYNCDCYESGSQLLSMADRIRKYDLIILDYEMDGLSGFETANQIYIIEPKAKIAFATNYIDLTREGYKYGAIRYLVKQDNSFREDLFECITFVLKNKLAEQRTVLDLCDGKKAVDYDSIIYVSSEKHYVRYFINGENDEVYNLRRCSLDLVAGELPYYFTRIHLRYLINLKYAVRLHDCLLDVKVSPEKSISLPVARDRLKEVTRLYCLQKGEF